MKKLLLIAFLFVSVSLSAQPYRYKGAGWKYIPKIQVDSAQIGYYLRVQGEVIQFTNPTNNQILQRENGVWKNKSAWSLAYDSVKFDSSNGILQFYKNGSIAISDTLDNRYPTYQQMLDSINNLSMLIEKYDSLHLGGQIVNTDSTQHLANKRLIKPIIADFTNALHNHADSASGGILSDKYINTFGITLPSASTVAGRCSAAESGTDYPSTWSINADGISPYNLVIHHGLHRHIASVTVFTVSSQGIERQLFANAAYSGIVANNDSTLTIESLATIQTKIAINLIFK